MRRAGLNFGMKASVLLFVTAASWACTTSAPEPEVGLDTEVETGTPQDLSALPTPIAEAYTLHTDDIPEDEILSYKLALTFGGSERFRGTIKQSPSSDRISLHRDSDDAELRYDGKDVAIVPAGAEWERARFAVFTWPYFFAAPMKLADAGTRWAPVRSFPWRDGVAAEGSKLTFASGTGDSADDYYVVIPDTATGLIDGMAYIVTFGEGAAAAKTAEPHAIRYSEYEEVDGVPIARRWDFYNWDPEAGLGDAIGHATLSEVEWIDAVEQDFATAGGSLVEMPE